MILREEKMAEVCPVTTEGGSDLHSRNFCGMFQFYLKIKYKFNGNFSCTPKDGYDARWISMGKTIRLFPFNTGLTGDFAQIYTHNLGPAIMEMEMMADNLAMGMGLYMRYEQLPDKINGYTGLDWLKYLQYLQQEVVQYYFGQRMTVLNMWLATTTSVEPAGWDWICMSTIPPTLSMCRWRRKTILSMDMRCSACSKIRRQ
jgi:hypothetical protein